MDLILRTEGEVRGRRSGESHMINICVLGDHSSCWGTINWRWSQWEEGDQVWGHLTVAVEMGKSRCTDPAQSNILEAVNIYMIVKLQNQRGVTQYLNILFMWLHRALKVNYNLGTKTSFLEEKDWPFIGGGGHMSHWESLTSALQRWFVTCYGRSWVHSSSLWLKKGGRVEQTKTQNGQSLDSDFGLQLPPLKNGSNSL